MSVSTEPQPTPEVIRLSIEDDEGVRATYPIIHEQIRVGRSEDNEICLNQKNISREHALLIAEPDTRRVAVHDLNSYTGIKLNGKRISDSCYLNFGDYLEIGGYVITLDIEGHDHQGSMRQEQGTLRSEPEPLPPEKHAKLVVVSNNLAGREYYLNRAELLIGREQADNDLVINHRSISRNHAKIVWKNDHFTIIDLSSSNGVLIGGMAMNPAPLTKGVIVQMGLVKFRYVAPGEEYTFNPVDLEVTALDETGNTKKLLAAILVFIIIFFLSRQVISHLSAPQTQSAPRAHEIEAPLNIPTQQTTEEASGDQNTELDQTQEQNLLPPAALKPEDQKSLDHDSTDQTDANQNNTVQDNSDQNNSAQDVVNQNSSVQNGDHQENSETNTIELKEANSGSSSNQTDLDSNTKMKNTLNPKDNQVPQKTTKVKGK